MTGAAGGMGAACAERFAGRTRLLLTDCDADALARAGARMVAAGHPDPTLVTADIGTPAGLDAIESAVQSMGGLRWVVHSAGLSPAMAGWREILEVDLVATARLLERLLPQMEAGGAAVCFASVAGHMGSDDAAVDAALDDPVREDLPGRLAAALGAEPDSGIAYLYAKRGVIRLCERWAPRWGGRGARLVSLSPGLMDTSMGRLELDGSPEKAALMELVPLVRPYADGQSSLPGRADDIADAVAFLCSDAASFIAGCDLRVDGGLIGAMRAL